MHSLVLTRPPGKNRWCGPTAIAALLEIETDAVVSAVKELRRNNRAVKGMYNREAKAIGSKLGYHLVLAHEFCLDRPTLRAFIGARGVLEDRRLLVEVTNHYVAVCGDMALCSLQGGNPTRAYSAMCARRRVRRVWEIVNA